MRTLKWLMLLMLCTAPLVVLVSHNRREPEPQYKGRSLSTWVSLYGNYPGMRSPAAKQEPSEAIRHIGTNALPFLLTWISYEPSPWRQKAEAVSHHLPAWIVNSRLLKPLFDHSESDEYARAQNAMQAFEVLGPVAAPAIPELARRISRNQPEAPRDRAIAALAETGPLAVPVMADVISNPSDARRIWVSFCVEAMGTNARPLIPLLLKNLQHYDAEVARNSMYTLGGLALEPTRVVPELTACLKDGRRIVRGAAPYALVRYGELARPALPALTNALSDLDPAVRNSANSAILQITTKVFAAVSPP